MRKKRKNYYVLGKQACNTAKTCDTAVMGCSVPLGQEFGTCTCTCVTHDHNTMELPVPMLHPNSVVVVLAVVVTTCGG